MDYVYSVQYSPSKLIYSFGGLANCVVIVIRLKLLEKIHSLLFFNKFLKSPSYNFADIFHNFQEFRFPKSHLFLDFFSIGW